MINFRLNSRSKIKFYLSRKFYVKNDTKINSLGYCVKPEMRRNLSCSRNATKENSYPLSCQYNMPPYIVVICNSLVNAAICNLLQITFTYKIWKTFIIFDLAYRKRQLSKFFLNLRKIKALNKKSKIESYYAQRWNLLIFFTLSIIIKFDIK